MDMTKHVQHLTKLLNENDVHQAVDYLRNRINNVDIQSIFTQLKNNQVNNYIVFKERFFS